MNSCKEKTRSIKTFIFSNESMPFDYSIKLNSYDSIYLQTRFPNPEKDEYGILRKEEKDSLFDLLEKMKSNKEEVLLDENEYVHLLNYLNETKWTIKNKDLIDFYDYFTSLKK